MKKYEIIQYYHTIKKYIIYFLTVLIVRYFLDGRKFTKDGLRFAIILSITFIVYDILESLYRKRKYKKKHN